MPPDAKAAYAAARVRGATESEPMMLAGTTLYGPAGTPREPGVWMWRSVAPCMIPHRSSLVPIAMYAEFTEFRVASRTDMGCVSPGDALWNGNVPPPRLVQPLWWKALMGYCSGVASI